MAPKGHGPAHPLPPCQEIVRASGPGGQLYLLGHWGGCSAYIFGVLLWDGAQPFVLRAPCHPAAPLLPEKGHLLQDLVADRVTKQPRGSSAVGLQHTRVREGSRTMPGMSLSLLE